MVRFPLVALPISRSPCVEVVPTRLKAYVAPLARVMRSSGPEPVYVQPKNERFVFAEIIASRKEQSVLSRYSSVVIFTVMDAADTGMTGSAANTKARIAVAVTSLLVSEEKDRVCILFPFCF